MTNRVVITGSAGRLGRAMVAALCTRQHTVVGYDLQPTPGLPLQECVMGSIQDSALMLESFRGADCLIHLAATPDDAPDNFESELVPNNITGSYRVLEAARLAGVPKVILASSGQVIDGHLDAKRTPVLATSAFQPKYLYACTKVFLEMLGEVYANTHGLTVLAVRFGWCPRSHAQLAEIEADPEAQDVYLSPDDAGRFAVCAVETPLERLPRYAVVYCTSLPVRHLLYDLEPARACVGFIPLQRWPDGANVGLSKS